MEKSIAVYKQIDKGVEGVLRLGDWGFIPWPKKGFTNLGSLSGSNLF